MPKSKKNPHDFSIKAHRIVQTAKKQDESVESESTSTETDRPYYVALGRAGGKKGGKSRADNLSPEQRKEMSRKAAIARWSRCE